MAPETELPTRASQRARFRRRARLWSLASWLLVCLPAAAVVAASLVVTPEDIETGRIVPSPACTWRRLTGAPCPTCGLTRALCALGHGRWSDALRYHPMSPAVYLALVAVAIYGAARAAGASSLARAEGPRARRSSQARA